MILGSVLAIDCIVLAILAVGCLMMSFSLFFMAAIPAFLVVGFLFILSVCAMAANFIAGAGTIITSMKGGKISKVFSVLSIIVDMAILPAQGLALAFCVYAFADEPDAIFLALMIIAVIAVLLCIAGTILNIVRISRDKATPVATASAHD